MIYPDTKYTTCSTIPNINLDELDKIIEKISKPPRICAIGSKEIESGKIFVHNDNSPICIEGYDKTIWYNLNDTKIEEQLIKLGVEFLK